MTGSYGAIWSRVPGESFPPRQKYPVLVHSDTGVMLDTLPAGARRTSPSDSDFLDLKALDLSFADNQTYPGARFAEGSV